MTETSAVVFAAQDEPAQIVRVWSPVAVAVYALVIAYPAGLILAVKNWQALNRRDRIGPHVAAAIGLSLLLIPFLLFLPRVGRWISAGLNIIAFSYLKERLKSDLAEFSTANAAAKVERRSWYSALGWALLGVLLFVGVAVEVAALLVIGGVLEE